MQEAMKFLARDPTNSIVLFEGHIGSSKVTAAAVPSKGGYTISYAVCSRKEPVESAVKGIALAVDRLLRDKEHAQQFRIGLTARGGISPLRLAAMIRVHIEMDAIGGRVRFPPWFVEAVRCSHKTFPEMHPMPEDYYRERIVKDKTPMGNHLRKFYRKGRKVEKPNEETKDTV